MNSPNNTKYAAMINYNFEKGPDGLRSGDNSYRNLLHYESLLRKAKFDMVSRPR
jgi:hypothetical protein